MENSQNYFFWHKDEFKNSIRQDVCRHCPHYSERSDCRNPDPSGCVIMRRMPEFVMWAQKNDNTTEDAFIEDVKHHMKLECQHAGRSSCSYMDSMHCDLKPYLLLLYRSVRDTDQRLSFQLQEPGEYL